MLFRKMIRDMRLHKTQFVSIFLMSLLGVYIYSGISSEWNGLQNAATDFYKETNMADAWIYGGGFSQQAVNDAANVDGVAGVERRLTVEATADLVNKPAMTLHFVEKGEISSCLLIEGEEFFDDPEGIWVDYLLAKENKIEPGDKITLSADGISLSRTVRGTVMHPEYVYAPGSQDIIPNHAVYGFGYLSYKAFPDGVPLVYSEMLIKSDRTVDMDFEEAVEDALDGKYSVFLDRKDKPSYMQFNSEIEEHKAMGSIFPVAFLAVAMLTILTTMVRLVNNQRTQIGILKAVGFSGRRILLHYISYGFWVSLAGAVIGAVIGPVSLPYLFYGPMKTTFTLPKMKPDISFSIILMAAATVIGCTLTTYLACRNNLKDTPAECLRPKAPKMMKHNAFDRLKLWERLGFNTQWNLRDAFRSKVRCLMAIVGVLGCSGLLVCAFGLQDSMDDFISWNFNEINKYETKLVLDEDVTEDHIKRIIKDYNGEPLMEGALEVKANGVKKSGSLLVTDHVTLISDFDQFRKKVNLPEDGISISYKLARLIKVSVGDEFMWHIYGDEGWNTAKVGAIYRAPMEQGIKIPRELFEKAGYSYRPNSVLSAEYISSGSHGSIPGVSKIWSITDLMEGYNTLQEAMNLLLYVMILAAVVLAVVVLYNLGVLSFTERQRELSTLKVIGFKTGKLRSLLLTQNIWMTAVGSLLGIPFGLWIIHSIFRYMGDTFDFMVVVEFSSYIYSILGTFVVSILVNRLFSRRVKNLDMVSSLKIAE